MRFHHLGIAVADLMKAVAVYEEIFGYRLIGGPIDDEIQGVTACFLASEGSATATLELVAPLNEQSPIKKFVGKTTCAYHTCYETDDLERALAHAWEKGCLIISDPKPAIAYSGRRIAWILTPIRQLVEVLEK